MRFPRKSLFLCKACGDEDRRVWGRSYWRRSHQVPGIEWCDKHELPLYEAPRNPLQLDPSSYTDVVKRVTNDPYPRSEVVRRYIDLAGLVLTLAEPIPVSILQDVVRRALRGTDIRSSVKGKRPPISDYTREVCPREWLNRLIPRIADKEPREYFPSIDNAAHGTGPTQPGALLALALLYEDVDQCSNLLLRTRSSKGAAPGLPRRLKNSSQAKPTPSRRCPVKTR